MATSQERQKANLARIKRVMEEIENTANDCNLIAELHELLRKPYSLSLKWHMIVFKSEIDRSLWHLEDIRREEIEFEKIKRRKGKGLKEESNHKYNLSNLGFSRNTRANVFAIPKSMIGDSKLQWSEEVEQKWGEDNIGKRELMEKGTQMTKM